MRNNYPPRFTGKIAVFFALFLALAGKPFASFASPGIAFAGSSTPGVNACQNVLKDISSVLVVNDASAGQTLTWTVSSPATNGSVVSTYSVTSTSGANTPTGITYTPNINYVGTDGFSIQVTNGTQTITATFSMTVNAIPVFTAGVGTNPVCAGGAITLTTNASAGGGITYLWTGGLSGISNNTAIDGSAGITNAQLTDNTVYTLTATTPYCGTTSAVTSAVTVNQLPTTLTATISPTSVCVGTPITFTANSAGGVGPVTYSWTGGASFINNSTAIDGSTNISSSALGDATAYTLTASVAGCTSTAAFTGALTVNADPTVTGISNGGPVCVGTTLTLGMTSSANVTDYLWSGPVAISSSTSSSASVPSANTSATGTYTLTVSNGAGVGCTAMYTTSAVVNPFPSIESANNDGPKCAGSTLNLSVSGALNVTDYLWTGPVVITNATSASAYAASETTDGTGLYTVAVTNGTGLGCTAYYTTAATINPIPSVINGNAPVCVGSVLSLSDDEPEGSWSTSNSNATVDASGNVTGVTQGTVLISYKMPADCAQTVVVTVNPLPEAILGSNVVCMSASTTLTDVTTGGIWTSSVTGTATVNATSGAVTGVAAGPDVIIYTLPTGCQRTLNITVNPITPITGAPVVCAAATTALTDLTPGGNWSSSNIAKATVDGSGNVMGIATTGGTATITYLIPATGCKAMAVITVNAIAPISGANVVCMSATIQLSDAIAGGSWGASGAATVGSTGIVTGVSAGTAVISYGILSTECGSGVVVTVNPITPIQGNASVCTSGTTSLSDLTPGGTWSSSNTVIATISTGGTVTGVATTGGAATITYTIPATGCKATVALTENKITPILGATTVCTSTGVQLSDLTIGGSWSATGGATVGSSGFVSGVSAGTAVISYNMTTGCGAGVVITVNQMPTIFGPTSVCAGSSLTLTDDVPGGAWMSTASGKATIGSATGLVTGIVAGSTIVSYTSPAGCKVFETMITNPSPASIHGLSALCVGATISLSDAAVGGSWTGDANASVDGSGNVLGLNTGTSLITYQFTTGCATSKTVTVAATPSAISGSLFCPGATTTLTNTSPGGVWTSSNTISVSIDPASGFLTALASGASTISYVVSSVCVVTTVVSVNTTILPISGNVNICTGTTSLSDATLGGAWSSVGDAISIGSTGIVTALAPGTATVFYTKGTCSRSVVVTVNSDAGSISGNLSICTSSTTTLNNTGATGTWSSGSGLVAAVNASTGVVTSAITAGTTTITFTAGTGCIATAIVTVNAYPAAISGRYSECVGDTVSLVETSLGGTWSASNENVSVDDAGHVIGETAGSSRLTYTLNGCSATYPMAVNANPASIVGSFVLCPGTVTYLSDATPVSSSYTSSNPGVATILNSGAMTGVSAGTTTITYKVTTGCIATQIVTVTTTPTISGNSGSICPGSTLVLSDGTGAWTSSNNAVATVGTDGTVTGVAGGTSKITFTMSGATGCMANAIVTVNPAAAIAGSLIVCQGSTTHLSDATTGGIWSTNSGSGSVTVGTSGIVTGVSGGTATVLYSVNTCTSTATVTVNDTAVLSGNTPVCAGSGISLDVDISGGSWSSSASTKASVDGSGNVTGVAAGSATISYLLTSGCRSRATVTVGIMPANIAGANSVCTGLSITLSDATTGGTWSSIDGTGILTVGSTGTITGNSAGSATVSYTKMTGSLTCNATMLVFVNKSPVAMPPVYNICAGSSMTLSDSPTGGTWTSSNENVVVDEAGNVTAALDALGSAVVKYTLSGNCSSSTTINVNILPSAIMGVTSVCPGSTTSLSDIPAGGTWSTTSGNITVGLTSGLVSGITSGTATVVYAEGAAGCTNSVVVTVTNVPATISGSLGICAGTPSQLSDGVPGGTWHSSNTLVATINTTTGLVTPVATTGTAKITYTASGGCTSVSTITINANPAFITGPRSVCLGATVNITDATGGGSWSSSNGDVSVVSGSVHGLVVGSTTISYTSNTTNCSVTYPMVVNPNPTPIFGTFVTCVGSTALVTDTSGVSSSYTSNTPAVASILNSGVITGVSAGTSTITYTMSTGCYATQVVTINASTPAISGNTQAICPTFTLSLSDTYGAGTWSSNNATIATVGTDGTVTGHVGGTAVITYVPGGTSGCSMITIVTVNPAPAITGPGSVCANGTINMANSVAGTWSTTSGHASIGSSGTVSGSSAGTALISYTTTPGCVITDVITVNAIPATIQGTFAVCTGSPVLLSDVTTPGSWSTGTAGHATVDGAGNVTGVSAGTATITYTAAGCFNTATVTVYQTPNAITGPTSVCAGLTIALADATPSGNWSSTGTATVSGTGVVGSATAGPSVISYTIPATGCGVATTINVITAPGQIQQNAPLCAGTSTVILSDAVGSGTWTSSNASVVSVDAASGLLNGVSGGLATVTYTLGDGCFTTTVVTVNPITSINGPATICTGATITFSDATGGGSWTATGTAVSMSEGALTGLTVGTTIISYTISSTTCAAGLVVSVNQSPTITASSIVCQGTSLALTDDISGGTWSNTYAPVASINSAGVVTAGTLTGTTTISYLISNGCVATATISVDPIPAFISGPTSVCVNGLIVLGDTTSGGSWTSNNNNVTLDGTGGVTGAVAGSSIITYTGTNTCYVTRPIVINPNPTSIIGAFELCQGTTVVLSDATGASLSYTSSAPSVATVINSGLVTGVSQGTAMITYSITSGCFATQIITVDPAPAITGNTGAICANGTLQLTDAPASGVWSSGNGSVATVGSSSGLVTAVAGGTARISFTSTSGCIATTIVTVNPILPINGPVSLCSGTSITLSDATLGGTWGTSDITIATVGLTTGVVTGAGTGGIVQITYTTASLCVATVNVTVSTTASPITGSTSIACLGHTVALTDAVSGGTWSSSSSLVATVSSTGVVTGSATRAGAITISYTVGVGCVAVYPMTVNANPSNIMGVTAECVGATVTLSDASGVGAWTSNNTNVTVDGSGRVLGNVAGTSIITYTQNGCYVTYPMSVRANPVPMTGNFNVCMGTTGYVYDASTVSMSYTSSNPGVATITNAGLITPISAGSSTITYTINTGCYITQPITVYALPVVAAISAPPSISHGGAPAILTDVTPGGVWNSSNSTVIALSGAGAGSVTATAIVTAGSANISYTVTDGTSGCSARAVKNISVTARFAGTSTGNATNVYAGATVSVADNVYTGTWTSGDDGIATVDGNGVVTGIKPGVVNITHKATNNDGDVRTTITPVVVSALPATVSLVPNPNKGVFMVKGSLGSVNDEEVTLEVTDVLGQVIYKTKTTALGGKLNETISLNSSLPNGAYMLNVHSGSEKMVFHFVIEQ